MFVTPWMQCRHRGKINVKRPATHLERNILAAITKPIYLDKPDEAFINRCSVVQRESKGVAAEQVCERNSYSHKTYVIMANGITLPLQASLENQTRS